MKTQSCAVWNPSCHFMQSYSIARDSLTVSSMSLDPLALGELHSSWGRSAVVLLPPPAEHSWREVLCSCQPSHTNLAPEPEHAAEPTPERSPAALCWWMLWDQQLGKLRENWIVQEFLMVQLSFTLTGNFFNIMTKKYSGTSLHNKVKEKKKGGLVSALMMMCHNLAWNFPKLPLTWNQVLQNNLYFKSRV